jgi:hypothetical protein
LRKNCLLKHVIEGKDTGKDISERKMKRRRKQLPDDLQETRYWKLKEKDLDCTL